jgi:hypothetical protein
MVDEMFEANREWLSHFEGWSAQVGMAKHLIK